MYVARAVAAASVGHTSIVAPQSTPNPAGVAVEARVVQDCSANVAVGSSDLVVRVVVLSDRDDLGHRRHLGL